jgi:hypothetical protein
MSNTLWRLRSASRTAMTQGKPPMEATYQCQVSSLRFRTPPNPRPLAPKRLLDPTRARAQSTLLATAKPGTARPARNHASAMRGEVRATSDFVLPHRCVALKSGLQRKEDPTSGSADSPCELRERTAPVEAGASRATSSSNSDASSRSHHGLVRKHPRERARTAAP